MRTIKVACISDTHCQAHNIPGGIPECDLLLHAGDITYTGRYEKLNNFDEWGASIPLPPEQKVCIAGNHDITLEGDIETARAIFARWTYLQDELHEVLGLKIWGTPWSPAFGQGWGFQLHNEQAAEACWDMIPEDTDIVLVHGPPFGYGDLTADRRHVGCKKLNQRLMKVRPLLTVCGHLHGDSGIFAAPWGTVVNACTTTEGYKPKRRPIMVNLRM